jgi:CYTH domain-containing protein
VANRLLSRLPADRIIHKTRYYLEHCGGLWEVDYFDGPLNGLVIAEIELLAPDQTVVLPDWVGREITEDHRFGNSSLLSGVVPALDRAA